MMQVTRHTWGWKEDTKGLVESDKALRLGAIQLNAHLGGKSWLVSNRMTLADIVVFNALLTPFSFVFDSNFRKAIPHLTEWFVKVSKLPFVARNAGFIKLMGTSNSKTQAHTVSAAKKQKGEKQDAKPNGEKPGKNVAKSAENDEEFDPFADDDDAGVEDEQAKRL